MSKREEKTKAVFCMHEELDPICDEFERRWKSGERPDIGQTLDQVHSAQRPALLYELIQMDLWWRRHETAVPNELEYHACFPEHAEIVTRAFESHYRRSIENGTLLEEQQPAETILVSQPADPALESTFSTETCGDGSDCRVRHFGEYELLQEIARGGMGVVYKAKQIRLNRIVALKMILSGQQADGEEIQRFKSEAEAAARLDHPGIVPIYEIGEFHGQHYFSMSFVDGESLASRLKNGPIPPKEAAIIMRKVAEAVAYAHRKGVIHRDLKPANILLDALGEPKVTDFGLAKQVESPLELTQTGAIMGTPSFMPPEQALSHLDEIGPKSDVYSLGAVLYCLLTGRPPFQSANPLDVLRQVIEHEPIAPIVSMPSTPKDLDTICQKCLQKSTGKRYSTASELAADLDRYLEGRPISARPVGKLERLWRWCKRNPSLASSIILSGLLLLILAVGGPLIAIQQSTLRRKAEQAQTDAENNAAVARDQSELALRTLDSVIFNMQRKLPNIPETTKAKTAILQEALKGLREISQQMPTRMVVGRDIMVARNELGDIFLRISEDPNSEAFADAKAAYESGFELAELIARGSPSPYATLDLAVSYEKIGDIATHEGRVSDAVDEYLRARDLTRQVLADTDAPKVIELRNDLSVPVSNLFVLVCDKLSRLQLRAGRTEDAHATVREALDVAERAASESSGTSSDAFSLATALSALGDVQLQFGELREAKDTFELALSSLDHEDNAALELKSNLYRKCGDIHRILLDHSKAMSCYTQFHEICTEQLKAAPDSEIWVRGTGISEQKLGDAHLAMRKPEIAVSHYERSFQLFKRIAEASRGDIIAARELAVAHHLLATACMALGDLDTAYEHLHEDLMLSETIAAENPSDMQAQRDLLVSLIRFGVLQQGRHQYRSAWQSLMRSVSIGEKSIRQDPRNAQIRIDMMNSCEALGELANRVGDYQGASLWFARMQEYISSPEGEAVLSEYPASWREGLVAGAEDRRRFAVQSVKALESEAYVFSQTRGDALMLIFQRVKGLALRGDVQEAFELAQKHNRMAMEGLVKNDGDLYVAGVLYNSAQCYGMLVNAVDFGTHGRVLTTDDLYVDLPKRIAEAELSEENRTRRMLYIESACDALDKAISAGWNDYESTLLDWSFSGMHSQPRYQGLIEKLSVHTSGNSLSE